MKKLGLRVFLFNFFLILMTQLGAQTTNSNPKMDEFIAVLDQTPFIKNYKRYRNNTESKVLELKLNTQLDLKAVNKVKIAYKQSQFKFDEILEQLKRDLATPAGRSRIKKSPQLFSLTYQRLFEDAKLHCDKEFHEKADLLVKTDGNPIAILLFETLFSMFKSYLDKSTTEKAFDAAYLETKFLEPLRFKSWDKITE